MVIDNTQYSAMMLCEGYWYEKYVNKTHIPYVGERDDPLAIGIATHDALENGYKNGQFKITDATLAELCLTPEALLEVRTMVEYYRNQYPNGPVEFSWMGLEEPLTWEINPAVTLLAKVDGFFQVEEAKYIPGGVDDILITPGIYSYETKTKIPGGDRGFYRAEWEAAMQASFQILTLRHRAKQFNIDPDMIKGVLVNVIERPNVYEPRRTCKGCNKLQLAKYYAVEGKTYTCPNCSYGNNFTGTMGTARVDPPYAYRFLVERSPERLALDLKTILRVANRMQELQDGEAESVLNRTNCVITKWKRKCEYFDPHNALTPVSSIGYPGFELFNPTAYLEKNKNNI